ncbi:hypothetical protein SMACR_09334 [Sordaria macrospora]|uniref:WGS project CABT00000000 data, contig 2.85 n=2 Tax=Sordaria macrospora TaxID=5147 RepID=F7WBU8_SORMK|nr:uncharacterized protein SMAC_09334 [Sordaria macrospora k-hell]KAA8624184.1 hypothetical protein SMACR_09334 [Sordaria macrospora]WPJ61306.1 hypothetical protein SMAC4_09334 [Sordaria macrospora]CCC14491.1 unnamed protein product [Sordaria macrospora k-hell]
MQKTQAQVRAVRPAIATRRVSVLPGPTLLVADSASAANQIQKSPAKRLRVDELWSDLGPPAAVSRRLDSVLPPPFMNVASQAVKANAASFAAGRGISNGLHSPVSSSSLFSTSTATTTTTLSSDNNNNKDKGSAARNATKLEIQLKRLDRKLDNLKWDRDYYRKEAQKKS